MPARISTGENGAPWQGTRSNERTAPPVRVLRRNGNIWPLWGLGTAIYNYGSDSQTTVCRRAHAERLSVHDRQSQRKTGLRGASPETIMTGRPGGGGARYDYRACRVAATIRRSITNSDCYPRWLRWAAARRQGGAAVAFENRCSRFVAKLVPEGRFVRWSLVGSIFDARRMSDYG